MLSFAQRIFVPERMESPDCDAEKLRRSYEHLATINKTLSRMGDLLRRHVLVDVARLGGSASVLDFGCGGGDVLAALARAGARAGIHLRLVGLDGDPRAVAHASRTLAPYANARVLRGGVDALDDLPEPMDYVFCNHVLHHIPPEQVALFLRKLRLIARRRLIVNDLERSATAYALYTALAAVAFRNSFAYGDGRLSIRKGFRVPELQAACAQAGFPADCHVRRMPPWRVVIIAPGG